MKRLVKILGLGSVFGFILGLLFAPQKGEETRKKFQEAIEKGKAKLKDISKGSEQ